MASVIMGNEYDNSLIGTEDAEKLNSGDGADIVDAGAGDDKVNAGDGDDTITGGTGDDYINGGDGFDTAVYNGIVQTYINKDGLLVITDGKGNAIEFDTGTIEGTDTLRNIDALQFNNYTYYLDGRNNAVFAIDDEAVTTESSILNNIEILANDIDLDGDTLSVTKIDTSDSIGNFTLNLNGTINYSPNSGFTYLAVGDTAEDTVTYTVTDGNGSIVTGILTVTITGINDAPIITEPVSAIGSENDAGFSVNLLDGASDVDHSDTLSITNLTLISGDDSGITITGMNLGVNPDAYDFLNDGEDSVITYSYNIIDGHGGSTSQTATITITGISDSGISGVTVDGYFQGATVFVDSNNNLILDASEESTFTDGEGGFALSSSGPLVMTGGVDVATGLEFEGMLRAPDGATSITALSTIVSELMDLGLTKFDAEKQLSNSLENIDTSIDVLSLDPVAASLMGTAGGQEVMATASQVLNTVIQIASLLEGAGAINMADNMAEIFTQIAIDLNNLNTKKGVITLMYHRFNENKYPSTNIGIKIFVEQLKEIKLLLDSAGYNEAHLQSAWRNQTNQDIAASIIGYIRQAALGEALVPFEQRVAHAMQNIYSLHSWTAVQRRWLDRLAKQLSHEVVIDQQFVNRVFANDGGAKRLDSLLNQELDSVLGTLAESLWINAA